jgi:hypothetical protein
VPNYLLEFNRYEGGWFDLILDTMGTISKISPCLPQISVGFANTFTSSSVGFANTFTSNSVGFANTFTSSSVGFAYTFTSSSVGVDNRWKIQHCQQYEGASGKYVPSGTRRTCGEMSAKLSPANAFATTHSHCSEFRLKQSASNVVKMV